VAPPRRPLWPKLAHLISQELEASEHLPKRRDADDGLPDAHRLQRGRRQLRHARVGARRRDDRARVARRVGDALGEEPGLHTHAWVWGVDA
tara:strand:- start:134 stop:406 length:273 start_codon:yes stop_codon:yes gene_type:complete